VRMASETPAEILNVSRKGRIRPGADADLVVLGPEHTVEETVVAGETLYHGGGSMSGSKMSAEIREQPEVLERILEEGWGEMLSATRDLRRGNLRSVMIAARGTSDNAARSTQNTSSRCCWGYPRLSLRPPPSPSMRAR